MAKMPKQLKLQVWSLTLTWIVTLFYAFFFVLWMGQP